MTDAQRDDTILPLPRLLAQGNPTPPQEADVYLRDVIAALDAAGYVVLHKDDPVVIRPLAERWPDGSVHDYRCQGECVRCWGADACGMVGQSCIPCTGSCVERTGAVTRWEPITNEDGGPWTTQETP